MPTMSQFYRAHDIDPTVVTVKVGYYHIGDRIEFTKRWQSFQLLCGEYWFSRKSSSYVYRQHMLRGDAPQPTADWLIDNRPSISDIRRYGDPAPAADAHSAARQE